MFFHPSRKPLTAISLTSPMPKPSVAKAITSMGTLMQAAPTKREIQPTSGTRNRAAMPSPEDNEVEPVRNLLRIYVDKGDGDQDGGKGAEQNGFYGNAIADPAQQEASCREQLYQRIAR